jgi:hypothetical protein
VSAAQRHLANQQIGPGDLFLFFGWFRRVQQIAGQWTYDSQDAGSHTVFGWLQVGYVVPVDDAAKVKAFSSNIDTVRQLGIWFYGPM